MGVELLRKYVSSSMRICYRSVMKHPFLVAMVLLLISMYRLFPLLFSLLLHASPVIVSTAVLLGTLLSLGQPNIPEIENEKEVKSDQDEIENSESKVVGHAEIVGRDISSASEETNGSKIEVGHRSFGEKTEVNDDNDILEDKKHVGLVDDSVFLNEKLEFGEDHLIEEAKNEVSDQGIDVDEGEFVLESHYSQLRQSEDEHIVLQNGDKLREGFADPINSDSGLLWKRVEGDDYEDDEGSDSGLDSGSDLAESSSPDASMADIIPMLDELHPLLAEEQEARQPAHMSDDGSDAASEHSLESSESSSESNDDDHHHGVENHEDLEVEEEEEEEKEEQSKHADKEDVNSPAIKWTEDDQKNLMDLGTSELERNQRLENLIARRRARKAMRMQAEKNLIDLESTDLPWNISPISTTRNNPFDISYDSNNNIPGSAPSVLLPRRNPFDLPYDSSEEKPDLVGDTFQQDFTVVQPKEPFFRRYESFNVGPSIFGASRQARQETKLRPYFVPEGVASDGTSFSSFQRQFSDLSDTKVSSVPDTESIGSAGDLENKDHIDLDLSREELILKEDHEHNSGIIEKDKHVNQGSDSSEDDGNVESVQIVQGDDTLDEAKISIGDVTDQEELASDFPETEIVASSAEIVSDSVHLNLSDQVSHSSVSSLSSSYEASEQVYNEKQDDEMPASVSETTYYFMDHGNTSEKFDNDTTSLAVEESQPKEPVYDMSPRSVTKNRSSSSISTDLQALISERGLSPPILERPDSFSGRGSQETEQKSEMDCPRNDAEFVDSSERDAVEVKDPNLNASELNSGSSMGEDHLHEDKSFHNTKGQLRSLSSVVDFKGDSTDSSPETMNSEVQRLIVPDNEEPLLSGDEVLTPLPNERLHETEDSLLDMEAAHQLEQVQVPSSSCDARSNEDIHEDEVISHPEELSLLDMSMDKPSMEDPEELQVQITSNNSDNLQIQEPENVSLNIDSTSSADVVEVTDMKIRAPETPIYVSDLDRIENNNDVPDHTEYVDEIKEFDENLLVELDAVGDFSVNDLGLSLNEIEQDPHGLDHDLETYGSGDLDSYSKDVGSVLNEMKRNPHGLEHDLEANRFEDEDSYSKGLGSTLDETKEDPHGSEHDLETNHSGDEDSYFNDLGSISNEMNQDPHGSESTLNEMKQDPHGSESTLNEIKQNPHGWGHDLESERSVNEDSFSKDLRAISSEMNQDPPALKHDLETNRSKDDDSYSKNMGSTLNEMNQDPHGSEHHLENYYSINKDSFSDFGSILNERKQNPHASAHDLETNHSVDEDSYSADISETKTKTKTGTEDVMNPQNDERIRKTEVADVSEAEASTPKSINEAHEAVLHQKTDSSTPASTSSLTSVNRVTENASNSNDSHKE